MLGGVDALSFGGTKQGMLCGEAVVFLRPGLGEDFPYWQKHTMQLGVQDALHLGAVRGAPGRGPLGRERPPRERHGAAARRGRPPAARRGGRVPGSGELGLRAHPPELIEPLQQATFFWPWDERSGVVRWMCAFDTEPEDATRFVATLSSALARHGPR